LSDDTGRPRRPRGARPLGDLIADLVDPIVARKAGMTTGLIQAWTEIAGVRLGEASRPEKLVWPPQRSPDDPFEPATLVIACESAFALRLQHEASQILSRVNTFFGYGAVSKIRIVQRPVRIERPDRKPKLKPLTADDHKRIADGTQNIASPRLRAALERYGATVIGRNGASDPRKR